MTNNSDKLVNLSSLDGYLGSSLVDSDSGMVLGTHVGTGTIDLEVASAGNTEVVKAKRRTMKALGLEGQIEDILITLSSQYHLIRPLASNEVLFLYLALDRQRANLAIARMELRGFEKTLEI